LENKQIIFPKP